MRHRVRGSILAVGVATAALVAVGTLGPAETAGQGAVYQAPRLMGTPNPDLNGIWQAMGTAHWDIEDHSVEPGPFPTLLGTLGVQPAGQSIVTGKRIPISGLGAGEAT